MSEPSSSCFHVRFTEVSPAVATLLSARALFGGLVVSLRGKAQEQTALAEIPILSGPWEDNRVTLARLLRIVTDQPGVFDVLEISEEGDGESLSPEDFRRRLKQLRQIELQTQRDVDLERGHIARREDFVPHDEDWLEAP